MILFPAWGYLQHFREKSFWHFFFFFYSLKNNVLVWWPNYDTVIHLIYTFAEQAGSWWDPLSFDCNNLESLPCFDRQYWQSQQVIISVIMISRLVMRPLILWDIVFLGLSLRMLWFSLTGRKSLFSLRKLWTTIIEFENSSFTENLYFVIDTFHCADIKQLLR